MRYLFLLIFLFIFDYVPVKAKDTLVRIGVALNNTIIYSDSTFIKPSTFSLDEGELVEILSETVQEHDDDSQNQKYKWYKIKNKTTKRGWVFGDAVAIIVPDDKVEPKLKPFHHKILNFGTGFEKVTAWVAVMEGRDNLHKQNFLNPPYKEFYLVLTNEQNKSVMINYGGLSASGKNELRNLLMQDVTGDGIAEIVLEHSSIPANSGMDNKELEIFGFQGGTLMKLFDERLSLAYEDDVPAPSLSKSIDIFNGGIRIAYIDYVPCNQYHLSYLTNQLTQTQERCLEYVTYTYAWNKIAKQYQKLYSETRIAPQAKSNGAFFLKEAPSENAKTIVALKADETLTVIKHYENILMNNNIKKCICYLYVRNNIGQYGYIEASKLRFINSEHAALLNQYYNNPPLIKTEWESNLSLITIEGKNY